MTTATDNTDTAEVTTDEAPTDAEQSPTAPEPDDTATEPAEGDPAAEHDAANPNREAAKYRTRLREAEAERDGLAGTVDTLRKQLAADVLGDVLAKPDALWSAAGANVADYFGEDGTLDRDALREAGRAAVTEHGLGPFKRFQGSADGGTRGDALAAAKVDPFKSAADAIRRR